MKNHGEVYLHVGNSGAKFKVIDEGHGPTIVVTTGAFGNLGQELKVHTTCEALAQLSKMFGKAALVEGYSEPYCHAAKPPGEHLGNGESLRTSSSAQSQ